MDFVFFLPTKIAANSQLRPSTAANCQVRPSTAANCQILAVGSSTAKKQQLGPSGSGGRLSGRSLCPVAPTRLHPIVHELILFQQGSMIYGSGRVENPAIRCQRPYSPWTRSGGRRDGVWYQDSDTLLGRTSTGRGCQLPAWVGGTGTRIQYAARGCGARVAVGSSQMAISRRACWD